MKETLKPCTHQQSEVTVPLRKKKKANKKKKVTKTEKTREKI